MTNETYLPWALTKDRNYDNLKVRLQDENSLRMLHSVIGLSGEVGELTDTVKKSLMYGKPLDLQNVKEECGDILWYLSLMLDAVGSSFSEVMQMNHDKLEKRYPSGFSEQHAQARMDKAAKA